MRLPSGCHAASGQAAAEQVWARAGRPAVPRRAAQGSVEAAEWREANIASQLRIRLGTPRKAISKPPQAPQAQPVRRHQAGSYGHVTLTRKERAGAREDACPPGNRGWAMAQRPPRPGGMSSPSRHNGREGHGQVFPPVNELVDADVHLLAGRRCAVPDRVQVGETVTRSPITGY